MDIVHIILIFAAVIFMAVVYAVLNLNRPRLYTAAGDEKMILREVDAGNIKQALALKVDNSQSKYISSNAEGLAQTYILQSPKAYVAYVDGNAVGFATTAKYPKKSSWKLYKIMIDANHQGKGYGRMLMELLLDTLRPHTKDVYLSVHTDNKSAVALYEKTGWKKVETEGDSTIYAYHFD